MPLFAEVVQPLVEYDVAPPAGGNVGQIIQVGPDFERHLIAGSLSELMSQAAKNIPLDQPGRFAEDACEASGKFDYMEFKESIKSLGNVDLDEETKFKSAMAMAKTMGATPSQLKSSANYYLAILSQEETKFNNAYKQRLDKIKADSTNKMQLLDKMIVEKEKQLKILEADIKKHKSERLKLSGAIEKSDSKANQTKKEFDHANKIIASQISTDLEKLEKYLK